MQSHHTVVSAAENQHIVDNAIAELLNAIAPLKELLSSYELQSLLRKKQSPFSEALRYYIALFRSITQLTMSGLGNRLDFNMIINVAGDIIKAGTQDEMLCQDKDELDCLLRAVVDVTKAAWIAKTVVLKGTFVEWRKETESDKRKESPSPAPAAPPKDALHDINDRLTKLEERNAMDHLYERVTELEKQTSATNHLYERTDKETGRLIEITGKVTSALVHACKRVTGLEIKTSAMDHLYERVDELEGRASAIEERIDELKEQTGHRYERIVKQTDKLMEMTDKQTGALDHAYKAMKLLNEGITKLETNISNYDRSLDTLETQSDNSTCKHKIEGQIKLDEDNTASTLVHAVGRLMVKDGEDGDGDGDGDGKTDDEDDSEDSEDDEDDEKEEEEDGETEDGEDDEETWDERSDEWVEFSEKM
jgi:uncharacterized coiled-coil protein SlyX